MQYERGKPGVPRRKLQIPTYDIAGWISEPEAAEIRSVDDATIGRWIEDGYIQSFYFAGAKLVSQSQVIAFQRPKLGRPVAKNDIQRIMPRLPDTLELTLVLRAEGLAHSRLHGEPRVKHETYHSVSVNEIPRTKGKFKVPEYELVGWIRYREGAKQNGVSKDAVVDRMNNRSIKAFMLHSPKGSTFAEANEVAAIELDVNLGRPAANETPREYEPLPSVMRIPAKLIGS